MINATNDGAASVAQPCDRRPFADFIAHIEGGPPALIGAADTLAVTEACLLARDAADTRKMLTFPLT